MQTACTIDASRLKVVAVAFKSARADFGAFDAGARTKIALAFFVRGLRRA